MSVATVYCHRPDPDAFVGKVPKDGIPITLPMRKGLVKLSDELCLQLGLYDMDTAREVGEALGVPAGTEVAVFLSDPQVGLTVKLTHHKSLPRVQEGFTIPAVVLADGKIQRTPDRTSLGLLENVKAKFGWRIRFERSPLWRLGFGIELARRPSLALHLGPFVVRAGWVYYAGTGTTH